MTNYIIRRALLIIPTLLGVSLLVTGMTRLLPGDAVDILVSQGDVQASPEILRGLEDDVLRDQDIDPSSATADERAAARDVLIANQLRSRGIDPDEATLGQRSDAIKLVSYNGYKDFIREQLGLDKNYIQTWWAWISNAVQGDFGKSTIGGKTVNSELKARVPVSIELGVMAMLFGIIIAIPTGILSAVMQDRWPDYILRSGAIAMIAVPSFAIATFVIALSARWWDYSFPVFYKDIWEAPQENLELVVIPALILGVSLSGTVLRLTRAQMLEVLRQDYIRTAWAKGLAGRTVVMRHAVKNAMMPVVTVIGLQIPVVIGGSVIVEQIFAIPGVARYLLFSISARDFPPMISIMMIVATVIVITNLVVDLTYAALDPRVKLA